MAANPIFPSEFSECKISSPEICSTCGLKNPTVFSVDKICDVIGFPENQKRCDEFVFCQFSDGRMNTLVGVYVLENKADAQNHGVPSICGQLQRGAEILEQHMPSVAFGFLPVLASGKQILRSRINRLRKQEIVVRGQKTFIEFRTTKKGLLSQLKLSKIPPR